MTFSHVDVYAGVRRRKIISSCHERGIKKKKKKYAKNLTPDLWIPRSSALPLSHRDSVVREGGVK